MLADKALNRRRTSLFVAAESNNQISGRNKPFCFQAQKGCRQGCRSKFVVKSATPEKVAILLDKCERVTLPVLRQSFYNIHMSKQEYGFFARRSVAAVGNYQGGQFLAIG